MTFPISPLPGFNWMAVSWGGPNQVRTDKCSYCDTPLDDDEVPLILLRDAAGSPSFAANANSTGGAFGMTQMSEVETGEFGGIIDAFLAAPTGSRKLQKLLGERPVPVRSRP